MNEMPDGLYGRIDRMVVNELPGTGVNEITDWIDFPAGQLFMIS